MAREEPVVDDVLREYDEHNERLRGLTDEMDSNAEEWRRINADAERIVDAFDGTSDKGTKEALLFELDEVRQRWRLVSAETDRIKGVREELQKEGAALEERFDAGMENVRAAALETERMMFELGKLVATLDVAAVVAMSAVTPALLPRLGSLEGLWPALVWLLVSTVTAVVMCFYSIMNVSQLVARGSARPGGQEGRWRRLRRKLPDKISWAVAGAPYALLLTFSAGSLLIGLLRFALFVGGNLG